MLLFMLCHVCRRQCVLTLLAVLLWVLGPLARGPAVELSWAFRVSHNLAVTEVLFSCCSCRCCQRKIIHFNGSQITGPLQIGEWLWDPWKVNIQIIDLCMCVFSLKKKKKTLYSPKVILFKFSFKYITILNTKYLSTILSTSMFGNLCQHEWLRNK